MNFNDLLLLVEATHTPNYLILIVEDSPLVKKMLGAYFAKFGIDSSKIKVVSSATDAILFIGEHKDRITHYSLDYDLEQGEKGAQVAEFIQQQGNTGDNVWIHSGNPEGREEILYFLPSATVAPSPTNAIQISEDINQTGF